MNIGDPYLFSIIISKVEEWNIDDAFDNGVLFFCINGELFPKKIINATLKYEIPMLKEKLLNVAIDKRLFNLPSDKVLVELYDFTFSEEDDRDDDYRFNVTPDCFADLDYYMFAVSDGNRVRILATKLCYERKNARHILQNLDIHETYVSLDEMRILLSKLKN